MNYKQFLKALVEDEVTVYTLNTSSDISAQKNYFKNRIKQLDDIEKTIKKIQKKYPKWSLKVFSAYAGCYYTVQDLERMSERTDYYDKTEINCFKRAIKNMKQAKEVLG